MAVLFSPGGRTAWHSHAVGLALHVTGSLGYRLDARRPVLTTHPSDTLVLETITLGRAHVGQTIAAFDITLPIELDTETRVMHCPAPRKVRS
jgi:hypothetical protein